MPCRTKSCSTAGLRRPPDPKSKARSVAVAAAAAAAVAVALALALALALAHPLALSLAAEQGCETSQCHSSGETVSEARLARKKCPAASVDERTPVHLRQAYRFGPTRRSIGLWQFEGTTTPSWQLRSWNRGPQRTHPHALFGGQNGCQCMLLQLLTCLGTFSAWELNMG